MDDCNIISDITSIVLTLAAVFGAVIAAVGLWTWRYKLHGQADFDLARSVLRGVYELHNEIRQIRNIFSSEFPNTQYERLNKKASELDLALLEAKILWGDKLQDCKETLKDCLSILRLALIRHAPSQKQGSSYTEKQIQEINAILDGDDDDDFGKTIGLAVAKFEDVLCQYLKRRNWR